MTIAYKSWVSETGTLTGTDPTYTLPGTASTPTGNQFFRKISSAFTTTSTIVLTITAATGAETSVWTYTPGASGAAGTITRATFLESSTGSTINWSGVTANISGDIPAPVSVTSGAPNAGLVSALNSAGVIDGSMLPRYSAVPSGVNFPAWPEYWTGSNANAYSASTRYRFLFEWYYPFSPTALGFMLSAAAASGVTGRLGFYGIDNNGNPTSLIVDSGDIPLTAASTPIVGPTISASLPAGKYIADMILSGTGASFYVGDYASNSNTLTRFALPGGPYSGYYQFTTLLWSHGSDTYGAMPTTPLPWSDFSNNNSTYSSGNPPVICATS